MSDCASIGKRSFCKCALKVVMKAKPHLSSQAELKGLLPVSKVAFSQAQGCPLE